MSFLFPYIPKIQTSCACRYNDAIKNGRQKQPPTFISEVKNDIMFLLMKEKNIRIYRQQWSRLYHATVPLLGGNLPLPSNFDALFNSFLFYSILFYSILFYSILFYSILLIFYSILFYSILFCSVLFCSVLFCSVLFFSILFYITCTKILFLWLIRVHYFKLFIESGDKTSYCTPFGLARVQKLFTIALIVHF